MSNAFTPLRRSNRLRANMYEKYVTNTKQYMQEIIKLMGEEYNRAKFEERIVRLTKIMRILIKGFKYMLVYGVFDVRIEPLEEAAKMFKNIYFRTFVWMKEAEDDPEGKRVLGKQVYKYREIYRNYRSFKIGIERDAFGLSDDLVDVIDGYI